MHRVNKTSSLESHERCDQGELLSCGVDESENNNKRGAEQHTSTLHFSKAAAICILLSKLDSLSYML